MSGMKPPIPSALFAIPVSVALLTATAPQPCAGLPSQNSNGGRVFRFGISLSLQGSFPPDPARGLLEPHSCGYCWEVKQVLDLWCDTVNRLGEFRVAVEYREDNADESTCLENYAELAQSDKVDFLFGPAYSKWHAAASKLAEDSGKVMLLWAVDYDVYWAHPLPHIETMASSGPALPTADSIASGSASANSSELIAAAAEAVAWAASYGPGGSELLGSWWNDSLQVVFDLNAPEDTWAQAAIDDALQQGSGDGIVFAWFANLPGASWAENQCRAYFQYASANASVSARLVPLTYGAEAARGIHMLVFLQHDILVWCGRSSSLELLLAASEAASYTPAALLVALPLGGVVTRSKLSFNTGYLVDSAPLQISMQNNSCTIFEDFASFTSALENQSPGFAAVQVAAAAALFAQALGGSDGNSSSVAAFLRQEPGLPTLLGPVNFSEDGRRQDARGIARQLFPRPGSRILAVNAFPSSTVQFVLPEARTACEAASSPPVGMRSCEGFRDTIAYPAPQIEETLVNAYPCRPGCAWRFGTCEACPPGRTRDAFIVECQSCPAGRFADSWGTTTCAECPIGAECNDPAAAPKALPGYDRLDPPKNWDDWGTDAWWESTARSPDNLSADCTRPVGIVVPDEMAACLMPGLCLGDRKCVGSNQGVFCGQCPADQSLRGFQPGMRYCRDCESPYVALLQLCGLIFMFVFIARTMSHLARRSAFHPAFLSGAMIRSCLHYVALLMAVLESTNLDAEPWIAAFATPMDIVIRPLNLVTLECSFGKGGYLMRDFLSRLPLIGLLFMIMFRIPFVFLDVVRDKGLAELCSKCKTGSLWLVSRVSDAAFGDSSSDEEESAEEAARRCTDNPFRRASIIAYRQHTMRKYIGDMVDVMQQALIWCLLTYPISIRAMISGVRCVYVNEQLRMWDDWSVSCETEEYRAWSASIWSGCILYACMTPACIFAVTFIKGNTVTHLRDRMIGAYIWDGYVPRYAWWEAVIVLRSNVLTMSIAIADLRQQSSFMGSIVLVSLVLNHTLQPFDKRARSILHRFETLTLLSALIVLLCGELVRAIHRGGTVFSLFPDFKWYLSVFIVCLNLVILGVVAISTLEYNLVQPFQISLEAGAFVSKGAQRVQRLARGYFETNPVRYETDPKRPWEATIDISELTRAERDALLDSMMHLFASCLRSNRAFQSWHFRKATDTAFLRALVARKGKQHHDYYRHGKLTHSQSDFWYYPRFSLPPVDYTSALFEADPRVTVGELDVALRNVADDIRELHPQLTMDASRRLKSGKSEGSHWGSGASETAEENADGDENPDDELNDRDLNHFPLAPIILDMYLKEWQRKIKGIEQELSTVQIWLVEQKEEESDEEVPMDHLMDMLGGQ